MKRWIVFFVFFVLTVLAPGAYLAADIFEVSNEVTITAVVPEYVESVTPSGDVGQLGGHGGDGGGVAGVNQDTRTLIQIEGFTFPNATIQLMVNGLASDSWFAEEDGSFSRDFRTDQTGTLRFSFSAHDGSYFSSTTNMTLVVDSNQILDLGFVLLSPVLHTSDDARLAWDGYSIPGSQVTVWVNGEAKQIVDASSRTGAFSFLLESGSTGSLFLSCEWEGQVCGTSLIYTLAAPQTSNTIETGAIEGSSQISQATEISDLTDATSNANNIRGLLSDLNEDGRVNYVDFGLMREAYLDNSYYSLVDLDNDGSLDLVDFSLLAYQWTIP